VIPAAKAKRDAFGNWSPGERNQAISGIGGQRDRYANTTEASRKRNRRRATYFLSDPDNGLSPGIWRRNLDGSLDKVALFTDSMPSYTPRLTFYQTAQQEAQQKFPGHFARRFLEAIATAR
jgi:hypothetical protein